MLKKRIIPCLDVKDGRTVKGINFKNIRDAGDAIELAKRYVKEGADELVILDISATIEKRKTLLELIEKVAYEIHIPFTVGGGISSCADVEGILKAGADKISVNSAAVRHPGLIQELSNQFGSQCVVVAIDTKYVHSNHQVYISGGQEKTGIKTIEWAMRVKDLGAGEILLTSMDHDGTKKGYALDITDQVAAVTKLPVIASGGAGRVEDFANLFSTTQATGGLAASIFHYREVDIPNLKSYLQSKNINVRCT